MVCSLDIRKDIIDDVSQKLSDKGATIEGTVGFFPNPRKADDAINSINKEFEDLVVKAGEKGSFTIDPSNALIDKYLVANKEFEQIQALSDAVDLQQEEIERGGYTEEDRGEFYQLRNIFNSLDELHLKLRNINKTPNSIGSDSKMIDVLKKAGLDVNQRTQFIKLVTDNPELKELKLSTILDSYLKEFVKDSDKAYYNAIDEPLSKELEDTLINYFDKFHIKREQLDSLKDKFGVDSVGVFDVLAKTVYYAKNRNLLTLPEEYGHVFVELLGTVAKDKAENKLFNYLSNNIEKWDGYARVFEDYKNQYVTAEGFIDAEKIKKEAIGQAIGIALVSNYKNNKNANQSFWNKLLDSNKDFWTKIQEVIDHLYSLLGKMDYVNINLEIDKIAKDIISKNYSKLDRVQKNTSNYNLLSYSETIEQQNKKDGGLALSFMKWFSEIGNIITGSLSYRLQGNTYRPEIDALHDIDMMVGSDIHKIDLKKSAYLSPEELERDRLYRKNISEGNYKEANKYKMQGNIKIDLAEIENSDYFKKVKEKYPDLDLLYTYVKPGTSDYFVTVNAVWSKRQDLKDKFKSLSGNFNSRLTKFTKEEIDQMYLFDFFLMPEVSEKYITVEDKEYGLRLDHFTSSFYAKLLGMGRPKDAYDYQNWELLDDTNNIAPDLKDRLLYFQLQQSIKDNPQFQLEDMEMSKASSETLDKIKEACKKMGINIQDLADYAKATGLDTKTINGVADLVKGIVAIAEGREDVALTEEMVHLATAILEQTNPKMVTEMIAKIDRFQIYKKVFDLYKNNKNYQLPNGKPDIRKIKKEAVDKLIAEVIINQNEGDTEFPELMSEINQSTISSWWNTIIDKIRGMYKASNISIFETAATQIIKGEVGNRYANITVKNGVSELFDSTPELSNIGTPEQYSAYIDSIFPDSKVKDIVYHGSKKEFTFEDYVSSLPEYTGTQTTAVWVDGVRDDDRKIVRGLTELQQKQYKKEGRIETGIGYYQKDGSIKYYKNSELDKPYNNGKFEKFKKRDHSYAGMDTFLGTGNYFTTSLKNAKSYARTKLYSAVVNIKNAYTENKGYSNSRSGKGSQELIDQGYDAVTEKINDGQEYNVFEPKQIHILGNKQDLEGFREFVASAPATFKGEGVFYQVVSDKQQDIQQKLQATKDNITKVEASAEDKNDPLLLDSEEANNYYAIKQADGTTKKIVNRVTDRVKAWYEKRFKDKTFTEKEQAFNELKRTYGVAGHKDFEEIHARYFNPDGTRRSKPLPQPRKFNLENKEMYQLLENYYVDLINSFPNKGKDCLFFSEVIIYDDKYKEGEAGTIDLLVVEPSGKAHIFDWKFMNIPGTTDDVAWFKQNAFGIQLGRYKEILKEKYGVKEFGMIRAIPIVMDFVKSTKKVDAPYRLKGIAVGSVDSKQITDLRLMPVSEETESTGLESLDETIRDLNSILVQVGKEKVSGEEELEFKIERLNTIRKAIRIVQGTQNIQPLVDVIKVLRKDGAKIVNDYNVIYKDKVATLDSVNDPDLSKFSSEMKNYIDIAKAFEYIDTKIGKLIYDDSMISTAKTKAQKKELEERRELRNNLREEVRQITESRIEIDKQGGIMGKFADKFIGQRHLVEGLEKPETVIKGISSFFRGVSDLGSAALNLLYKITNLAKGKAMQESLTEVTELMKLRENIVKKGGDVRKYIQKIYQKDTKGGLVNKLVHKYKSEFYDKVIDLSGEKDDKQWLLDNLNIETYKEEALKVMNTNIEIIEKTNYEGENEYEDEMIRDEKILEQKQKWDISRKDFNGWNNFVIYKHPNNNWKSNEYKAIESDKDLLALYDFIIKFNKKAKDMGYINAKVSTVFLPFIRKSMAESLAWDHSLSPISNFSRNLKIKLDDVGFGSFNEFTGEIENSIPKYYTYDFTYKDGVNDYSDVSEDIFKNLILYVQHANKYKYLSEVEDQLKIVKIIEEGKGHLATTPGGDIIKDEFNKGGKVIRNNDENSALFDNFSKVLLYDQKYVLSDADTPMYVNKILNPIKRIINYIPKQVTGKDLWEEGDVSTGLSMVKTIDAANKAFQIKTLGLDIIPGAVNWFGGNIQVLTQAGEYFSGKEYWNNETKLIGQKFKNKDERKEFAELINLFMPLKDDPSYELYKDAGLTTLTRNDFTDMLMVFMRKPEQLIEKSIFLSLLDNMMVDNGKIISIKEFVKNKYPNRSKSGAIYRETQAKMKKEVEELKKTRSISATKKLENGKLVIPGLDLTNRNELQRLTSLTRRISRNATGGLSDGDINKMSMSIWTKSMMLFKGWVPKLTDTRFSEFRKTNDDFSIRVNSEGQLEGYKYDVGRLRVLAYFFQLNLFKTVSRINDTIAMNDAGVEGMTKMFEEYRENYEKRTGEVLQMSREDFVDLIRQNLSNQMRELGILVSIMGAAISLGFMAPPPEADKSTKNAFRFAQRTLDKFESELSFFYNPANYEALVGGGMFPALGIVTDFQRFMTNFWLETTGFNLSDPTKTMDEVREKAQPIKYLMKMLPVTKSVLVYLAILNSDFAKEYDITVQKETSRR